MGRLPRGNQSMASDSYGMAGTAVAVGIASPTQDGSGYRVLQGPWSTGQSSTLLDITLHLARDHMVLV